jgi:hypothetical protein
MLASYSSEPEQYAITSAICTYLCLSVKILLPDDKRKEKKASAIFFYNDLNV